MNRARIFTNIDDTLMAGGVDVSQEQRLGVGAYGKDGAPASFISPVHSTLSQMLLALDCPIVPVTSRSREQLACLTRRFDAGAVLDFGATVLGADDKIDWVWADRMSTAAQSFGSCALLKEFAGEGKAMLGVLSGTVDAELRKAQGITAFVTFRVDQGLARACAMAVRALLRTYNALDTFYLHVAESDVTLLPRFVSKRAAVERVIESRGWGEDLLVGCGDSLSDCDFLDRMDLVVLPGNSRALKALVALAAKEGKAVIA